MGFLNVIFLCFLLNCAVQMHFSVHILQHMSMRRGQGALPLYSRVTCSDRLIMALLRSLYFYTTKYSIEYRAYYVPKLSNVWSDSLSRLQMSRFRRNFPEADHDMTPLCDVLLDSWIADIDTTASKLVMAGLRPYGHSVQLFFLS